MLDKNAQQICNSNNKIYFHMCAIIFFQRKFQAYLLIYDEKTRGRYIKIYMLNKHPELLFANNYTLARQASQDAVGET